MPERDRRQLLPAVVTDQARQELTVSNWISVIDSSSPSFNNTQIPIGQARGIVGDMCTME